MVARKAPVATWQGKSSKDPKDKEALQKIGKILKTFRHLKGLTQKDFAKEMGLSQNHLSNIEMGKREPGILFLANVARFLKIPIDLLLLPALQSSGKGKKEEIAREFQDFMMALLNEIEPESSTG